MAYVALMILQLFHYHQISYGEEGLHVMHEIIVILLSQRPAELVQYRVHLLSALGVPPGPHLCYTAVLFVQGPVVARATAKMTRSS